MNWLRRACAYEVEVTICNRSGIVIESFLMFTPQRWSGWSRTPITGAEKTGTGSGAPNSNSGDGIVAKGKGVNLFEPATPVSGSMLENGGKMLVESGGAATDHEVLAHRVSELENEVGRVLVESCDALFTLLVSNFQFFFFFGVFHSSFLDVPL